VDASTIQKVKAERAELLRKLAAVDVFLAAYGEQPASVPHHAAESSAVVTARLPPAARATADAPSKDKKAIENFTPYGRKAIATSMSYLIGRSTPVRTRELVDLLEGIGFAIRGENAINALGALLGRSEDIVSHGKAGWTLADPDKAAEIVRNYAHKENEPPSASADGSDAADEGPSPPESAQDQSNWGPEA